MEEITIPRISPLKIPMLMKAHWKAKEPFHLVGEPSTVKSALIKQTSKNICEEENNDRIFVEWSKLSLEEKKLVNIQPEKYFIFEDLRATETDIGELRLQNMENEEGYITYKYSLIFQTLSDKNAKGVLFFDEMNLALNMIKAQFYKVYNDRSIGDIPLSDNVLICSAGNESSQVRDVVQDSVALTTRRGNYFVSPLTAKEFVSYALEVGMHKSVIGYLSFAPEDVHKLKYDVSDPIGQACSRTWEKLSNILNANSDLSTIDLSIISRGLLGPAISSKYIAYTKLENAIKIEDVIRKPEIMAEVGDDKLQIVYAVASGLLSRYKQGEVNLFGTMCKVSLHIKEEIAVYMMRMLKSTTGENKFRKLALEGAYSKDFDECYKRYGDLLSE